MMEGLQYVKFRCIPVVVLSCTTVAASAADVAHGKLLHDTECLVCHTAAQYTRNNRMVDSLDKLRKRVAACRDDAGAEWGAAETEEVVQYLNSYYRF